MRTSMWNDIKLVVVGILCVGAIIWASSTLAEVRHEQSQPQIILVIRG